MRPSLKSKPSGKLPQDLPHGTYQFTPELNDHKMLKDFTTRPFGMPDCTVKGYFPLIATVLSKSRLRRRTDQRYFSGHGKGLRTRRPENFADVSCLYRPEREQRIEMRPKYRLKWAGIGSFQSILCTIEISAD
jgi:hypothetical protein